MNGVWVLVFGAVALPSVLVVGLTLRHHGSWWMPAAEPTGPLLLDCAKLVRPVDPSPIRSPQLVHSVLARNLAGKAVVEIGTRNGDGIKCWSRVTKSATAVEMDPAYCKKLRGAANFSVHCARYQAVLDKPSTADVYTWWQQAPHLTNSEALRHLRAAQRQGKIRATAEAVMLFDHSWPEDTRSWSKLQPHVAWHTSVAYDERDTCRALTPDAPADAAGGPSRAHPDRKWCYRAAGTFTIASIPIGRVT